MEGLDAAAQLCPSLCLPFGLEGWCNQCNRHAWHRQGKEQIDGEHDAKPRAQGVDPALADADDAGRHEPKDCPRCATRGCIRREQQCPERTTKQSRAIQQCKSQRANDRFDEPAELIQQQHVEAHVHDPEVHEPARDKSVPLALFEKPSRDHEVERAITRAVAEHHRANLAQGHPNEDSHVDCNQRIAHH